MGHQHPAGHSNHCHGWSLGGIPTPPLTAALPGCWLCSLPRQCWRTFLLSLFSTNSFLFSDRFTLYLFFSFCWEPKKPTTQYLPFKAGSENSFWMVFVFLFSYILDFSPKSQLFSLILSLWFYSKETDETHDPIRLVAISAQELKCWFSSVLYWQSHFSRFNQCFYWLFHLHWSLLDSAVLTNAGCYKGMQKCIILRVP